MNEIPPPLKEELLQEVTGTLKVLGHKVTAIKWGKGYLYNKEYQFYWFETVCKLCGCNVQAEISEKAWANKTQLTVTLFFYTIKMITARSGIQFFVPDSNNCRAQIFPHSFREFRIIGNKTELYCPKFRVFV